MTRIAILDDYQGVALKSAPWERLRGRVKISVFRDHLEGADALAARLAEFDVLVLNRERTQLDQPLIARLPQLKLVATSGMRNKAVDTRAAQLAGVQVCGTQTLGYPTVELTWALILGLARHLVAEAQAIQSGCWQTALGVGLRGKTLGIVGLGRVGGDVARIGRAFGMDVLGWSRTLTPDAAQVCGARCVPFEELLAHSDVLSIHAPLTAQTRNLIDAPQLARMKSSALLVNTARGGIVNEAALAEALRQGQLRGAALDVFEQEPLPPNHALLGLPNLLLTPHIGYVVEENYHTAFGQIVENIEAWLDGRLLRPLE